MILIKTISNRFYIQDSENDVSILRLLWPIGEIRFDFIKHKITDFGSLFWLKLFIKIRKKNIVTTVLGTKFYCEFISLMILYYQEN